MAHTFRPSWSGSIRLSLVSVPVKGFTALEAEKAKISLNQLHEECHNRIKYKKTCPVHGEVPNDEIVLGYQYETDKYAVIDPDEINKLRSQADRAVNIDRFVSPDQIDPVYYSGQTYYLLPDGKQAPKPYAVLQAAMKKENVVGIGQVVISNREQLVVVRPVGRLLTISVLHYDAAIRPAAAFDDDLAEADVSAQEVKLAKMLIDTTRANDPALDEYHNLYNDRLEELVQAKIAGEEIAISSSEESGPPVINIMDALKASLERRKPRSPGSGPKVTAATRIRKKAPSKRRKTG
jgi:DNA end-binding protein Ku